MTIKSEMTKNLTEENRELLEVLMESMTEAELQSFLHEVDSDEMGFSGRQEGI